MPEAITLVPIDPLPLIYEANKELIPKPNIPGRYNNIAGYMSLKSSPKNQGNNHLPARIIHIDPTIMIIVNKRQSHCTLNSIFSLLFAAKGKITDAAIVGISTN